MAENWPKLAEAIGMVRQEGSGRWRDDEEEAINKSMDVGGRVLVCGGRYFDDYYVVERWLAKLEPDLVIEGGAQGADELARRWCARTSTPVLTVYADWNTYGRRAGPIRNKLMLDMGVDIVAAFPGGKGTANMIRQAKERGVRVIECR